MAAVAHALEGTLAAALDYILSKQARDGSWTEWALPPGSSSTWTTAYVGYQLRHLPLKLGLLAASHIAAAAGWLKDHAFADWGWGYNKVVGSDADTTAYAILFMTLAGKPVPDIAYTFLADRQGADGGFSTYPPVGEPDSWNVSHPDVTPIALLALLTRPAPDREAVQRGIEYALRQKTSLGLWNSFWWNSCLYSTQANLALLDAAGIEMPSPAALAHIEPANAFEAGLLVSSLLYANWDGAQARIGELADWLIRHQRPDGSWDTVPILRIVRRDCYDPWMSDDPGPLYAEPDRLFTTATVLHALATI